MRNSTVRKSKVPCGILRCGIWRFFWMERTGKFTLPKVVGAGEVHVAKGDGAPNGAVDERQPVLEAKRGDKD